MFFLIDNLGRRNLLIIGAAGGSVCMWIIGGYISTKDTSAAAQAAAASQGLSSGGIAAIFFFYLWTAFYTPSWNGTPWVINSEMFDLNTRGLGQASASANNWFWVSFLHLPILSHQVPPAVLTPHSSRISSSPASHRKCSTTWARAAAESSSSSPA